MTHEHASIFEYYPPKAKMIGILSIPHSGELLPDEFKEYLVKNNSDLMRDVDFRVHELITIVDLQNAGVAVIKSNIIRTAIDLNRAKASSLLNWKKNSHGKKIVLNSPNEQTAARLIEHYYSPYYEMLKSLGQNLEKLYKTPSFVDLHSMPSKATKYHLEINPNQPKDRPDFCISDRSGLTCTKEYIDFICASLSQDYASITQNDPYFGGHITQYIQESFPNGNNIQIEIGRSIYMDETEQVLIKEKVDKLKPLLTRALIELFQNFSLNQ